MRGKSNLASLMLAALAVTASASLPAALAPSGKAGSNHRRVAPNPTGALKNRRCARKARNVKANRRNHRG